jgi:mannose-6-phosphate isomerase-like protein (cupin superfamily)
VAPHTNPIIKAADQQEYYFQERCYITELLNHAAVPGISVARARVAPGVSTVWHTVQATELYYLLSGRGLAEVGEVQTPVAPGDLVVIEPGTPQRITNTGTDDLIFLAICTPRFQVDGYVDLEEE